jgi:hypothetical protein
MKPRAAQGGASAALFAALLAEFAQICRFFHDFSTK